LKELEDETLEHHDVKIDLQLLKEYIEQEIPDQYSRLMLYEEVINTCLLDAMLLKTSHRRELNKLKKELHRLSSGFVKTIFDCSSAMPQTDETQRKILGHAHFKSDVEGSTQRLVTAVTEVIKGVQYIYDLYEMFINGLWTPVALDIN